MALSPPNYRPPKDGAPDSADPFFRARRRPCGYCGNEFETSPRWRYFCPNCRQATLVRKGLRRTVSLTPALGGKAGAQ